MRKQLGKQCLQKKNPNVYPTVLLIVIFYYESNKFHKYDFLSNQLTKLTKEKIYSVQTIWAELLTHELS